MTPEETPFPAVWLGIDLEESALAQLRPRISTYGRYPYALLPPPPCQMDPNFTWLSESDRFDGHVGEERAAENAQPLAILRQRADDLGLGLPAGFLRFIGDLSLHEHVRSNTDCYLDLCSAPVPSPLGGGSLVRFLADSQGILYWYLYLPPDGQGHAVVASSGFYGTPEEEWEDEPPDPAELVFVAESFEVFFFRFWIENEIWFAGLEKTPITEIGVAYIAAYKARGEARV